VVFVSLQQILIKILKSKSRQVDNLKAKKNYVAPENKILQRQINPV